MHFVIYSENTKVQALAPIISTAHYTMKESLWIALYNATHTMIVTLPQCNSFIVDYSLMRTPYIQKPIGEVDYAGGCQSKI